MPRQITIEEMLRAQSTDEECKAIRAIIDEGIQVPFEVSPSIRVLERRVYEKSQIMVPTHSEHAC